MTTTSAQTQTQVLATWEELIDFVLMTIARNKESEDPTAIEVAHALIDCDDMKKSEIRAAKYVGSAEAEEFIMPLHPSKRIRLQDLLLNAKKDRSTFLTVSRAGEKLIWSVTPVKVN